MVYFTLYGARWLSGAVLLLLLTTMLKSAHAQEKQFHGHGFGPSLI